jgi:hypothetical protein
VFYLYTASVTPIGYRETRSGVVGVAAAVDVRVSPGVTVGSHPDINPHQSTSPHVRALSATWPGAATDLHGLSPRAVYACS